MTDKYPANIHVSRHPCVRAKLAQLRSASTRARETKTLVHEISTILGCEALASGLQTVDGGNDKSSLGYEYRVEAVTPSSITIVPILRSGLGMVDAVQAVLPEPVPIHHLGMYREKTTLQPVEYYNNLPYYAAGDDTKTAPELAIVVDPIIATGSTIEAAIETLRDWGVRRIISIAILASEDGVSKAAAVWPDGVEFWVGGIDSEIDERGMIKPGLGDIGDRLYLTLGK